MSKKKINLPIDIPFLSGMYKGVLAIILGLILIFDPDKSEPKITYLMGMFWLASGIALLRHDPTGKMGKRLSRLISIVAIVTGLLVVVRYFSNSIFGLHLVSDVFANVVLGAVILLTGVAHLITEWELHKVSRTHILHVLLAIFEILLGLQLMLLPMMNHLFVRQTLIAWALLGGLMFIITAFYEHREHRKEKQAAAAESDSSTEKD